VGGGFSSPVVAKGRLIYMDEDGKQEVVHAVEIGKGRELWKRAIAPRYQDEWGAGPRSTPIIDGEFVYAQSCSGELRCLRLESGEEVWGVSFERDFGVKFLGSKAREGTASRRGNNGSGVIAGNRFVVPVGATNGASLVCFDKNDGRVLWKCGMDEAAYSSFVTGSPGGVEHVVAFTADALLGARLEDGRILWRVPLVTGAKRHASTPVVFGNRVIVNSHTFGMLCFEIRRQGDGLEAVQAWRNADLKINLATAVLVDNHLYSAGAKKDYICVEAATGTLKWSQPGFGRGAKDYAATIVTGKKLLVLNEAGELALLEANPEGCRELGRAQACGSTWASPALTDGKLYVRDGRELLCYDLHRRALGSALE
jgi:outer membrane protein assembly factor BamB